MMGNDRPEGIEFAEGEPQWYVAIGDEVYGPATRAELTQWAAQGRIMPGAQAVPVGGDQWAPLHRTPGLEGLELAPPPPPAPAAYAYAAARGPVPQRRLADCPQCAGPVDNVAPAYGWPWGFFQRSLRPVFRCGACGRPVAFEELPPSAQAKVSRGVRTGAAAWFSIVIGLILFIALCFFAAAAAFR